MKTRVTELLGCRYPILQGAMAGLGTWRFAASVADTGAHGTITASVSRTPERLRQDIADCRHATDGSFGVNLSFGVCPRIEDMLEVCIEEKVPVETAMYKPDSLAKRMTESGIVWIHKAARIKDALHAEALGADAVILVGLEGTGFKSPQQLPTMTTTVWGISQMKVPLIAAGGIGDARAFLGALAMGAEGVMMGTAFMLTRESPLKDATKEAIIRTPPDDPKLLRRVLASADPKAYAEVQAMRGKMPLDEWLRMLERVNLKDTDWHADHAQETPETITGSDPTRLVSLAIAAIDHVPSVKELVESMVEGAQELGKRLDSMRSEEA